jgi:hypothetical protein
MVVFRRERLLWLFGGLAFVSVALSLDITSRYWVPWRVLAHIPLIQNVSAPRFFAITTLCAAVMLGIVVDRTHDLVGGLTARFRPLPAALAGISAVVALGVGAVATVPMASAIASNVPFTTENIAVPAWFTAVAPHLAADQVVLTYPPPVAGGSALVWQAMDSLHFPMATGGGPESIPQRAGSERAGLDVITAASVVLSPQPPATPANIKAVRQALSGWGVTLVVLPDPSRLFPRYDRGSSTRWALGAFTLAIGREPVFQDDAWVWYDVQTPDPILSVSLEAFARCTSDQVATGGLQGVPACVEDAARRS